MADRILIAEDRENLREVLVRALRRSFDVEAVSDGAQALDRLAEGGWSVVVTNVRMPGALGTDVLTATRGMDRPPEVVMMTAYADVSSAVAALKAGAYDYLAKPFEPDDLVRVVQRAAERHRLVNRARDLGDALGSSDEGFIGVSPAAQQVRRLIERLGPMPVPVLITGETGTGKEVVARELHRKQGRGELIAVNCGAIPENLLEAELFGVARGAYTGAGADRPGLIDLAAGGTLFLDEIGDLPLSVQVKLNRVLEEREFRRVGDPKLRPVDTRVLSATHRDLEAMIEAGKFRQDLYFRLRIASIAVPPLRERQADLPLLAAPLPGHGPLRDGRAAPLPRRPLHPRGRPLAGQRARAAPPARGGGGALRRRHHRRLPLPARRRRGAHGGAGRHLARRPGAGRRRCGPALLPHPDEAPRGQRHEGRGGGGDGAGDAAPPPAPL